MSPQDNEAIERQARKFQKRRVNDHVYELVQENNPDLEVVFVHGLQRQGVNSIDAFWRTWKMRDSEECWPETLLPQLLQKDKPSRQCCGTGSVTNYKARVLSVTYENKADLGPDGGGTGVSDLYRIVENLIHDLIIDAGVGQKGVPVFFVGHDLGGILIKQFVVKVEDEAAKADPDRKTKLTNFLENLKSVFFFCTPHYGAPAFSDLAAKLQHKDANRMLCLMTVLYKETSRINMEFGNFRRTGYSFSTHVFHAAFETNEGGFHAQVVPEGTGRADADSFYTVLANHFTACQPQCKTSSQVQKISYEMKRILQTAKGHAN